MLTIQRDREKQNIEKKYRDYAHNTPKKKKFAMNDNIAKHMNKSLTKNERKTSVQDTE